MTYELVSISRFHFLFFYLWFPLMTNNALGFCEGLENIHYKNKNKKEANLLKIASGFWQVVNREHAKKKKKNQVILLWY